MSAMTIADIARRARPVEKVAYAVAAALVVSGLVHVAILLATGASWTGPTSLRKAATFGLSFGTTLASVAWVTSLLRVRARAFWLGLFTAACVVETVLVSLQAWRGVPSHLNFATPVDAAVAATLAGGGAVIVVTGLVFGVAGFAGAGALAPDMRLAVRTGLVVLLVAFAAGAVMIGYGTVTMRTDGPAVAYATTGFLKPLHFVAMHAVLVLPAFAWLLRFTSWDDARRLTVVRVAVVADLLLTALVAVEAFAGIAPLAPPPALAVATGLPLTVLVATGIAAFAAAVHRPARA
ncbi:MAG: hypothetical protein ABS81_22340 [Pseudonocardia sp. SCN 72-86]|nr:MAG: hypothetical protein ABS81_22340 [Pseudonocardia sp. SCN 72-86]